LKVAVLGSRGGMGSFFSRYFVSKGHDVVGYDPRESPTPSLGARLAGSNEEAVTGREVVLVGVPIDATLRVVKEILPHLKRRATIVEITSVKSGILPRLRSIIGRRRGVRLLSVHPLFGPTLRQTAGMKIAVLTVNGNPSLKLAKRVFPDANLIPIGPKEHDREIAVVLSLTHLANLAYAAVVAKHSKARVFRELASPTARMQLTLSESVLAQDPSLYSYLDVENPFSLDVLKSFASEVGELKEMVMKHDRRGYESKFERLSKSFPREEVAAAPGKVYQALESTSL